MRNPNSSSMVTNEGGRPRATRAGGRPEGGLVEHRARIEGERSPLPGDLLRLSIGLEDPEDLVADLRQALGR